MSIKYFGVQLHIIPLCNKTHSKFYHDQTNLNCFKIGEPNLERTAHGGEGIEFSIFFGKLKKSHLGKNTQKNNCVELTWTLDKRVEYIP